MASPADRAAERVLDVPEDVPALVDMSALRVAVVHDYLAQRGGAERVTLAILDAFPGARLITSVYEPSSTFAEFEDIDVETTWLNRLPALRHDPRKAFPLLRRAFTSTHIDDADIVICSSSGWAHAVSTSAPKIVYCHNAARWLYQPDDYLGTTPAPLRRLFEAGTSGLRQWDMRTAQEAARYVVNSSVVRSRVRARYGIEATVIAPPPGLVTGPGEEAVAGIEPGFLLTVGRRRGYKNTGAVIDAMESLPGERLVVVGGEPDDGRTKRVTALPAVSDAQLRWLYRNAAVLVAVAYEDFGLTPVEAFGFGTPVIALQSGGYLDTCVDGVTGLWASGPEPAAITAAVRRFRGMSFASGAITRHAERWGQDRFAARMHATVAQVVVTA